MRYTSMALYFYGASKKNVQKPTTNFFNDLNSEIICIYY
jgi:hypothetical protein